MITPADRFLLAAAGLLLLLLYALFWQGSGRASRVEIVPGDGSPPLHLSLYHDRTVEVSGPLGESILEIRDGRARFVDSPCPGKLCVQAGWLAESGATTACLPNRVILHLNGGEERFDAINF